VKPQKQGYKNLISHKSLNYFVLLSHRLFIQPKNTAACYFLINNKYWTFLQHSRQVQEVSAARKMQFYSFPVQLHGSFPIVLTSPIGHNTAGVMSDLNNGQCSKSDKLLRRLPLKVCLSNWQHRAMIDSIVDGSVNTRGRRKHNSFPTSKNNPYIMKVENELFTVKTRSSWIIWTDKSVTNFGITNDGNHFIVKCIFCSHNILITMLKS